MAEPYKHIYKVDLNQQMVRRDIGILATFDSKANRFGAELYRDGAEVPATGYTVKGYFIRPDEDTVLFEGTVEGNLVYVDIPANCYLFDGAFVLSVKISNDDGIEQTVLICDGILCKTETDEVIDGEYKIISVAEVTAKMAAVDDAVIQANTAAQEIRTAAENGEFDGKDGIGVAGAVITKSPDEYGFYHIIITMTDGTQSAIPYRNGADGFSPEVNVEQTSEGLSITITDANGTTTATVKNGSDATVTAENITAALGYTPANDAELKPLGKVVLTSPNGTLYGLSVDDAGTLQVIRF